MHNNRKIRTLPAALGAALSFSLVFTPLCAFGSSNEPPKPVARKIYTEASENTAVSEEKAAPKGVSASSPAAPKPENAPGKPESTKESVSGESPSEKKGEPPMAKPGNPMPDGNGTPPGGTGKVTEWDAIQEYDTDTEDDNVVIQSNGTDENAVHVFGGAEVKLTELDLERYSDDSTGGDQASFYGVGAAFLNTDGTAMLSGGEIISDSPGGAGVFSYGDGVTYAQDLYIDTAADTSGALHAAGGGKLYAWNIDAATAGESSAAIRSDRGGGTMVVDGGSYISTGKGSPALYCTADITVHDADLSAQNAEGLCLEGKNTVRLFDSNLISSMPEDDRNDCTWSVIVYQSMSGDSEEGEGTFEMTGGSLSSNNGGLFYTTNTKSRFLLSGVHVESDGEPDFFLRATGNNNKRGWGKSGENGADCSFTLKNQEAKGNVICDSISTLKLFLTEGSTLKGALIEDESAAGDGGNGTSSLMIDKASSWIVTGNSVVTHLACDGSVKDPDGKTVTIQGADGTEYVKGDSPFHITVTDYSASPDLSGVMKEEAWESFAVEKPVFLAENEYTEEETAEPGDEEEYEEITGTEEELKELLGEEEETSGGAKKAVVVIIVGILGVLAVLFWKNKPKKK